MKTFKIAFILLILLLLVNFSSAYPNTYTTDEQRWHSEGYWEEYDWTFISELRNFTCADGFTACCQSSGSECAGPCESANCGSHDGGRVDSGHYADCYSSSWGYWCTDSSEPKYWVDTSHWDYYKLCHYVDAITSWGACSSHVQWATDWTWGSVEASTCSNVSFSQYCNSPPTQPTVVVTPNSPPNTPKKADNLTCTITGFSSDPDGDPITYTYQWLKDSAIQAALTLSGTTQSSNTILGSNLFYKDTWTCRVTPRDNQGVTNSNGAYGENSVIIQNTPPTAPVIMPTSGRIISGGDINIVVDSVVDPDVLPSQARSQSLTYFGSIVPITSLSSFNKFLPVCNSVSCVASYKKTGLDRSVNNCIKLKVFDGDVNSPESDFNCLPVIDNIGIRNTTPGGQLANTSWIKNHFGDALDPYEQVSCTFSAHDKDNIDLRSTGQLDYTVTLLAKTPSSSSVVVGVKSGSFVSGNSVTENFTVSNWPSTTHTFPIGSRLFCEVQISDGFFKDDLLTFSTSSTWVPKFTWDNNTSVQSSWIEFVNTPPTAPSMQKLDRYNSSTQIGATVNASSVDPDVYSASLGGQTLVYFTRIWDQYTTPNNPVPMCSMSKTKGDFNGPLGVDLFFSIPLVSERLFSADARTFDGNEYSPCSVKLDSNETPFNPTCTSLGFYNAITPTVYNTPAGKTTVLFDINCNKSQKIIDNKWIVSIASASVKDSSGILMPVSTFTPILDCNSDLQSAKVVFDTDLEGTYLVDFNYGGVYNGDALWCISTPIGATVSRIDNPTEPDNLGLVIKDVVVKGYSDGTMDINFGMSAALATQVTQIDLYKAGTLVNAIYKRPNPPFNVPTTSFLDVSSKFNSSEPKAYSLTITYKGGYVSGGTDGYDDISKQKLVFSDRVNDVVHFDSVPNPERTLTIMFVLTDDGTAVFTPEEITAIPDSNLIVVLLTIIIVVGIISIKRK